MKFLEKKVRKYVVASVSQPTRYLLSMHFGNWMLVDDIEKASKTMKKSVAEDLKEYYYNDTFSNEEFVVVPVDITYELIEESD